MKTPDEQKEFLQKLRIAASEADDLLTSCDASDLLDGLEVSRDFMFEAACLIEQLESRIAQVEKERDFKDRCLEWRYNDLERAEKLIRELEGELRQVERERDSAISDMRKAVKENGVCIACKHDIPFDDNCEANHYRCEICKSPCMCQSCHLGSNYEWRGVCAENTEEE